MGVVVLMVVFVSMAFVGSWILGRFRSGIIFNCVYGTQRFAFRARQAPTKLLQPAAARGDTASCGRGNTSSHGKRVCGKGQTGGAAGSGGRTPEATLLLSDLWFTDVGLESGVRCSAVRIMLAGLSEA